MLTRFPPDITASWHHARLDSKAFFTGYPKSWSIASTMLFHAIARNSASSNSFFSNANSQRNLTNSFSSL